MFAPSEDRSSFQSIHDEEQRENLLRDMLEWVRNDGISGTHVHASHLKKKQQQQINNKNNVVVLIINHKLRVQCCKRVIKLRTKIVFPF